MSWWAAQIGGEPVKMEAMGSARMVVRIGVVIQALWKGKDGGIHQGLWADWATRDATSVNEGVKQTGRRIYDVPAIEFLQTG